MTLYHNEIMGNETSHTCKQMIPGPHLEDLNDACYKEIQPTIRS